MTITDRWAPKRHIPWPSEVPAPPMTPRVQMRPRRVTRPVATMPTPLLLIDVDGVLNPLGRGMARGFRNVTWRDKITYAPGSSWEPFDRLRLNPAHGRALARFSLAHDVELAWASLWEHNSNTIIAPVLDLPRLSWVDFHSHASRAWKWDAVADYAAGRPMAWLDDGFGEARMERRRRASGWARARRGLPTLTHRVDPAVGLTSGDLAAVASWLEMARLAW